MRFLLKLLSFIIVMAFLGIGGYFLYMNRHKIAITSPSTTPEATLDPTTMAPSTTPEATLDPTTMAPSTTPEATLAPTTMAPSTTPEATLAPTTMAPSTTPEATLAPTTMAPSTTPEATLAPTTMAPTTIPEATLATATKAAIPVRYVVVQQGPTKPVSLTEVQVFNSKGVNIALKKPVTMSSVYGSGQFPGSNLVNGGLADFVHTQNGGSVTIDLGQEHLDVKSIIITNRYSCCKEQINGSTLTLLNNKKEIVMTVPSSFFQDSKPTYEINL